MGQDMINDLEFEKQIETWSPAEQFIARQTYEIKQTCCVCKGDIIDLKGRVNDLENASPPGKKQVLANAASGGITGAITAAVIAIIEYFRMQH